MAEIVRASYQGLLLSDPRWSADDLDSASAVTESTPIAGTAEAENTTACQLVTSGEGVTLTDDVRVYVTRGGMPGAGGAAFAWRDVVVGTDYRGWDAPMSIVGHVPVDYNDALDYYHAPHAVTLADGSIVAVVCRDKQTTVSWTRDASATWSITTDVYTGLAPFTVATSSHPCVLVTRCNDVERVVAFYWLELPTGAYQVAMSYSDDAGATWLQGQQACLPAAIDTTSITPMRLRAAAVGGRVLLLAHVEGADWDEVYQYASSDAGCTFTLVDTLTAAPYGYPEVVALAGVFVVALLQNGAVSPYTQPVVRRLASPFSKLSAADAVTVDGASPMDWAAPTSALASGSYWTAGELALWADEDGTLYLAGLDFQGKAEGYLQRSQDGGLTWSTMGTSVASPSGATWWATGADDVRPAGFAIVSSLGQAVVLHRTETNAILAGQARYALQSTLLGGYSTNTLPMLTAGAVDAREQAAWSTTYLPVDLPDSGTQPWTKVTAGTPTVQVQSPGLVIGHTGVADTVSYYVNPTTTYAEGLLVAGTVTVGPGTAFFTVALSDGVHGYSARVSVTPTAIVLRDVLGSTNIATVTTTDGAAGVEVLLALGETGGGTSSDGQVRAWYRLRGADADREWIEIGSTVILTRAAIAANVVQWGTLSGNASAVAAFGPVRYAAGADTGTQLYPARTNPDDLLGRTLSPYAQVVTGGLKIAAATGPALRGDTFLIPAAAQYPLRAVLPEVEPSPQRVWRSTDDAVAQYVTWTLAPIGATSRLLSPVLGLYLGAINWRTGALHGLNALGSWVKIADIDTATGQTGLAWSRAGNLVQPNGSGATKWFARDELRGATIDLDGDVRKIAGNEAGMWATGTQQLRILLEDGAGAPTSGTAGAIRPRDYTLVASVSSAYRQLRLTVDAQTTHEGYHETGVALLGGVYLFASPYSWGRALEWKPIFELNEGRRGTRTAKLLATRARRAAELPWDDEIRERPIFKTSGTPDYVTIAASGQPWGVPADLPRSIGGVLERLGGPVGLCVYLPRIEAGSGAQHINHPGAQLYGRVRSEVWRLDSVQGTERDNEVWRGSKVRIEEEL